LDLFAGRFHVQMRADSKGTTPESRS
jgi:hypothetical protein